MCAIGQPDERRNFVCAPLTNRALCWICTLAARLLFAENAFPFQWLRLISDTLTKQSVSSGVVENEALRFHGLFHHACGVAMMGCNYVYRLLFNTQSCSLHPIRTAAPHYKSGIFEKINFCQTRACGKKVAGSMTLPFVALLFVFASTHEMMYAYNIT